MEPIAIIGLGCRFPGAPNPEAFWRVLRDGVDAIGDVPADRWDAGAFYDPDAQAPGKMNTRWGGFLPRVYDFDPSFFGISPREAAWMDPQQRLLLEVAWEALEDAGQTRERLAGSRTGVFVGATANDYGSLLSHPEVIERLAHAYLGTGISINVLSGRLSYVFDLQGPSLTIDTACSSSLVAVHLACQSLRAGESAMALAGGVHLILAPAWNVAVAKMSAAAPDGRCKTFDAAANGYVRSEGCGVVVLKTLSAARADGDPIVALIVGSAVNQDGRSNGLTAPNGRAQHALIRQALTSAGIAPADVEHVETHGTGTSLGDPIELTALGEALAEGRAADRPVSVGSIKTNIGHLEGAAGVAGLIKVALCLEHGELPPTVHYRTPNPHIPLARLPVRVQQALEPWPRGGPNGRLAGVSAFGWAGTNAHAILREATPTGEPPPGAAAVDPAADADRGRLLAISAHTPQALIDMALAYRARALAGGAAALDDVCYTAGARRTHHAHRLAVVCRSWEGLADGLGAFLEGRAEGRAEVRSGRAKRRPPKIAFVFSGQGTQWPGMARDLFASEPVFRAAVEECDAVLRARTGWSVLAEIGAPADRSRLAHTEVAQAAIFAVQIGLTALWRAWGVEPAAVVGHSLGEVAAAHTAGALTLEQAADVVWHRSRLMQRATGLGKMAQVELSEVEAAAALAGRERALSIAAVNGPAEVVVAGDPAELETLVASLAARGVGVRFLPVDYAFHSPQMDAFRGELRAALAGLAPRPAAASMVSTVTGALAAATDFDAAYWARNLREPVCFAAAVGTLIDLGCNAFVEIGPHPALAASLGRCIAARGAGAEVVTTLRRSRDGRDQLLAAAGALYARGQALAWGPIAGRPRRCVPLPLYAWQREHLRPDEAVWRSSGGRAAPSETTAPPDKPAHPEAAAAAATADGAATDPWLHRVTWSPLSNTAGRATEPGAWLLLDDGGGFAARLTEGLERAGAVCLTARPGGGFERLGDRAWALDPAEPRGFAELVRQVCAVGPPLRGVVHLWSLRAPPDDLVAAEALIAAGGLHLAQALAEAPEGHAPRAWLVTRGAQAVEATASAPWQAMAWGLGRVVRLEHPDRWGGLVDLAPSPEADEGEALAAELLGPDGEDQIALRAGRRYVARLVPCGPITGPGVTLRGDRTYLITGGFGALGVRTATWMASRGARHVALLGRDAAGERAAAAAASVRAAGAEALVLRGDVADADDVARALAAIDAGQPPLAGVVHAAGVFDDGLLAGLTRARFEAVLAPKVRGAWNLHQQTRARTLDLFVLFSSVAALLGSAAQGSYAAANACLDALASHRRGLGLPALSVQWSLWADGGMVDALDGAIVRRWRARGVTPMPPERALEALDRALVSGHADVAIAPIDWAAYARTAPPGGAPRLLAALAGPAGASVAGVALAASLERAPPARRGRVLLDHLEARLAAVLGLDPAQPLDPQQGFFDMGMDSLMAVELRDRLQADMGLKLSANVLFNYPTLGELAEHLLGLRDEGRAGARAEPAPARAARGGPTDEAELAALSESELAALLDAEVASVLGPDADVGAS